MDVRLLLILSGLIVSCRGFTSLAGAVEDALGAIAACRAPAQSSAPQLQIVRESVQHLPDLEGWRETMTSVHSSLSDSSSVGEVLAFSERQSLD